MRVLLTGPTRFIGSHLVPSSSARGTKSSASRVRSRHLPHGPCPVAYGKPATETDDHLAAAYHPRAATEEAADALIAAGACLTVLRLPQVHDACRQRRITRHVELAREKGMCRRR